MDTKLLRQTFGKFPTGVTVVTWFDDEGINGITVNSFTSVSLDPALALVSIDKRAKSLDQMKGRPFTINILSDSQEATAWQFAGRQQEDLQIEWDETGDSPSLVGSAATIYCKPWKEVDAGDHVLYIGEITNFNRTDKQALTFYEGKMGSVAKYV
ncbi:flavin reductase family protein [Ureibacillus acetophenoni]|uniref:Flavin reductase (DIM6/NTAB) family NADH-FMN oxidoreductase RutF n=1 Tax=Ureibacillus acetophenoni TaxID=614649 RepID=A0A285UE41_9BACL|nr:flavin reductase family protein [Ureibacillus acetophenoni]SOC40185.1 flavin reductase (DIM6/NTAB) family NADH-FMN oxidoreductase RutF [Ureibacillus acetophenoni]